MTLIEFLQKIKKEDFFLDKKILCFKGFTYPNIFFNKLINFIQNKKIISTDFKNLILKNLERKEVYSSLQQSFLGQQTFYWLSEFEFDLKNKKDLELLDFFTNYKGPNLAAFFLREENITTKTNFLLKKLTLIEIQEKYDKNFLYQILQFFELEFNIKKLNFIDKVIKQSNNLSLDSFCFLILYLDLINTKDLEQAYDYLIKIIAQVQPSLYLLSDYFFTRNSKGFFSVWEKIYQDYSEMFWIAFWSEQIWKAYYVIKFLKQNNFVLAKAVSYRLPFNFIKKDWKKFSLEELQNLHQLIYNIDFAVKNGSTFCLFDLFYFNHFYKT
ncbi:hypothetical protein K9L05_02350 [Candidatus Babeliales bacterium]|nr:hypothetical protein [Candidatus Babeliales bacterium]MCF7899467.1 hypothetical protein [Candidatus Babeliales bacterium]